MAIVFVFVVFVVFTRKGIMMFPEGDGLLKSGGRQTQQHRRQTEAM